MESKLQRRIIKDLKKNGWLVVKIVICNTAGWPDINAYKKKRAIFIEVKDKGKVAEPLQLYRHKMLMKQGFDVYVVDTWELYKNLPI